jgi:hypothetical protein
LEINFLLGIGSGIRINPEGREISNKGIGVEFGIFQGGFLEEELVRRK